MTKFFAEKKGEVQEIRLCLSSKEEKKRIQGMQELLELMTSGKNADSLFDDVLGCLGSPVSAANVVQLKKLIYIYLTEYGNRTRDRSMACVNALTRDSSDTNPMIRALSLRAMAKVARSKAVAPYLSALKKSLKDSDPFVVKTAILQIIQLANKSYTVVRDAGLIKTLINKVETDGNPNVVANSLLALNEIIARNPEAASEGFKITKEMVSKFLAVLDECTEWATVAILTSLKSYTPRDSSDAVQICERVSSRLQHGNAAVVTGAIRVIMGCLGHIQDRDFKRTIVEKLTQPLVTMLSKDHEIQYVALRNIRLLLQKEPSILKGEMKVFFVQYNDPVYVQVEKIELMIMLATDDNIDLVLNELTETTEKVDVQLVKMAIRAIARCAIKLDKSSDKCVKILVELISNAGDLAIAQEGISVLKDVYRRYPGRFEPKTMSAVTAHIKNLDDMEPGPKAALVWILGEYANSIDEAPKALDLLMTTFKDEDVLVQLNLLTSMVKLFLKKPSTETRKMVESSLDIATKETDNPDVRDRGYVYWRLLAQFPDKARSIVLVSKPEISSENQQVDPAILSPLLENLGTLSSVFHVLPENFIKTKYITHDEDLPPIAPLPVDISDTLKQSYSAPTPSVDQSQITSSNPFRTNVSPTTTTTTTSTVSMVAPPQPLEAPNPFIPPTSPQEAHPQVGSTPPGVIPPEMVLLLHPQAEGANGLQVDGNFFLYKVDTGYSLYFDVFFTNHSSTPVNDFQIKFNKNTYQVSPGPVDPALTVLPGQSIRVPVPCTVGSVPVGDFPSPVIQIALKSSLGVVIFTAALPVSILLVPEGRLDGEEYLQMWRSIEAETNDELGAIDSPIDVASITALLQQYLIFLIAERVVDSQVFLYLSTKVGTDNTFILMELALSPGECKLCTKTSVEDYIPLIRDTIVVLLQPLLNLRQA